MVRPQVRDITAPEPIQPVAQPVSTYVRPADPGRNQLADLAQGLAAFDDGLGTFMQKRQAETDEQDKAKALVDFHRNNEVGYADAVRQGLIPATASKAYVEWYKKNQGNLAGLKLSDKFSVDYQQWDGRNSGDPEAYQKFVGDWMKQNVGSEQDPYVLAGLAPHLDNIASSGYDTFNKDRSASLQANARSTSGAIMVDTIDRSQADGRAVGKVDYDALWNNLMQQRQEAISKGEKAEDFDKLIVSSVLLQAEESNSMDILKVLDRTVPGSDHPMSSDIETRAERLKTIERITAKQGAQATSVATQKEKLEKAQYEDDMATAVGLLSQGKDVPEDLIVRMSRRDGEARYKLSTYKQAFANQEEKEDQDAIINIYQQIDDGAGKSFVTDMHSKGVIKDPATFTRMLDRVESVKKANEAGGIFNSPTYKDTIQFLQNSTSSDPLNPLGGTRGISSEGMQALYDYRNMLLDWDSKHPQSTLLEKEKAAKEIGDSIRTRLVPGTDGRQNDYQTDADLEQARNAPPPVQTPQEPPKDERSYIGRALDGISSWFGGGEEEKTVAKPQEQSSQGTPQGQFTPQPIESLTPKRRAIVEDIAKTRNIPIEKANEVFQRNLQKILDQQNPKGDTENPKGDQSSIDPTVTNSISNETRTKLTSLLQDPPKVERLTASNVPVEPLLSLIGNTEGTDNRNGYNETLGFGLLTGGDVNLTGMTLGDIDKLQTDMLRSPNNKWNSSAIGRYQIVRTTLRGLKEEMGLTDDQKFTPELQDQMAMQLLKRRGLDDWQSGRMSDEQFMNNLSAEWASLPRASGRGTYEGQRVGTTPGGVRTALDRVRDKVTSDDGGETQVASLDPSVGLPSGSANGLTASGNYDPYANIPDQDSKGNAGQKVKFLEWNSDPIGNNESNLKSINPQLSDVIRRAQQLSPIPFVVGAGKRTKEDQEKAIKWGWSKTIESDHLDGSAADLWPLDARGAVKFDPKLQTQIVKAMKQAARELGVTLDVGADWKSFKDLPHFALKRKG